MRSPHTILKSLIIFLYLLSFHYPYLVRIHLFLGVEDEFDEILCPSNHRVCVHGSAEPELWAGPSSFSNRRWHGD
ncbi:hypothetical protein ACE6H2_025374 [Prunus campanulata]